ncbi:MAG: N-acetylneuraminate synthase [Methanobacteriota archaeon]|nr:MAG: N-acetylneuraminate synthase [Euryarchaeota archaeon]|tara:strand:+ start:4015 stop:4890 length:876 start_codon:yes stop_codon:yes gene_type:complete
MASKLKEVVDSGSVYIIAEIGQNHQGDLEHAKKLIQKAAEAGVNAVKSQKRHTRTLLTPEEYNRTYDSPNAFADTYGKHRDALELSVEEHLELKKVAESLGLDYFVSPWDPVSAAQMNEVGMPLMKIASASITDKETIDVACQSKIPIIFSTGMSTEYEIERAANWIRDANVEIKSILHCTSTYPAEFNQLNLNYISVLKEKYPDFIIGFSGHHRGISIDIAAVTLGAKIIERHFTLDRTQRGSDHAASLEFPGLSKLVRNIRALESAMGDGVKRIYEQELAMIEKLRRVK